MNIMSVKYAAAMMATLLAAASATTTFGTMPAFQIHPSWQQSLRATSQVTIEPLLLTSQCSTSSCLMAYRERSRYDQKPKGGSRSSGTGRQRQDDYQNNAFGDFEDDDDYDDYFEDDFDDDDDDEPLYNALQRPQQSYSNKRNGETSPTSTQSTAASSTFYSQKSLNDPSFSHEKQFFQHLCNSAKITRPSRIQSLAWPPLLRGENCIVADQTGSGKTLAYLLPLLQKLHESDQLDETATQRKKKRTGTPRTVILTPTAELADQIHSVCTSLSKNLSNSPDDGWTFNPFVTTATGSHSTNIRDQIRLLRSTPVDVLISTPGRLSTILRTKNAGLDLGHVKSLVLDEVDFLLVDETFGPQLRTVGVAVQSGDADADEEDNDGASNGSDGPQFIFVTATLPEDVLESIQSEFSDITQLRGPGLHRITPAVTQTLVDVSVPATSNRDPRACFDIKVRELQKALRGRRCDKTLVFCNTVETCRAVENVLRRKDRRGRRNRVWAYHNALTPEVRLKNLKSFSSGGDGNSSYGEGTESILVCTDRAARGIDFDASPIDHVLLFDFPKDPAEYVRRVGRTARAGRTGASTVLAYGWQLPIARKIMGLSSDKSKGKKGGKGKNSNAKLEAFTMMKSTDGWDEQDKEDEYYMKGGARRRKEISMGEGPKKVIKKKPKRNREGGKGKMWDK